MLGVECDRNEGDVEESATGKLERLKHITCWVTLVESDMRSSSLETTRSWASLCCQWWRVMQSEVSRRSRR